jgi:hypothetical protein
MLLSKLTLNRPAIARRAVNARWKGLRKAKKSITPLNPIGIPTVSPDPQPGGLNESKIIRRWVWRQTGNFFRAALFIFLGMLLGAILTAKYGMPQFEKQIRASYRRSVRRS